MRLIIVVAASSLVLSLGCQPVSPNVVGGANPDAGTVMPELPPNPMSSMPSAGELAVARLGCEGCHTGEHGKLAGSATAPNLTPDPDTGLAGWDNAQIIDAIRFGVDNEGATLCGTMPRAPQMSDDEAKAIVVYLRSLPAVRNEFEPGVCEPSAADRALHGQLVAKRSRCNGCHGPDLSGRTMGQMGSMVYAANITPDVMTGIGSWSDTQIATAITTGADDEGQMLCAQMPRFKALTEDELNGLVAYLRMVPAVSKEIPESTCNDQDPVAKGLTAVQQRHCTGCHGADLGGNETGLFNGTVFPPNLTPDMATGLGSWSADDITRALREGIDDEGVQLCNTMPRYATMTQDEANAIAAYLKSLMPISRTLPESACPSAMPPPDAGHPPDGGVVQPPDAGHGMPPDAGDMGSPDAGPVGNCVGQPVIISQVYGGGGNTNAVFNVDFVELHNRSAVAVDVSGYSLQYAAAAGTSWSVATLPAGTSLLPGGFVLVPLTAPGMKGAALTGKQVTPSRAIDLSASNGKLALVRNATALTGSCPLTAPGLIDLVGYGTANCHLGPVAAPPLSAQLAALRGPTAGAGQACFDTRLNGDDFVAATPAPRVSAAVCTCQ